MNTKKTVQVTLGIAISGAALWWVSRTIDTAALKQAFGSVNWWWVPPFVIVTLGQMYWRAIRWMLLLGPVKKTASHRLFAPLMIGMGGNSILPLRAGEVLRAIALQRSEGIPFAAGFSTVAVERLLDGLALLLFIAITPLFMPIDQSAAISVGDQTFLIRDLATKISIVVAVLLVGIVTMILRPVQEFGRTAIQKLPMLPQGVRAGLLSFYSRGVAGLESLRDPRTAALLGAHSLGLWALNAFTFQLMAWGFPGLEMTFWHAVAYMVITCLAISVPSAPGFWGVYEAGGKVALVSIALVPDTPAGQSLALAYTLVVHFFQWLPITLVGTACWFLTQTGSPVRLADLEGITADRS
jgi:uncharacterized protein (TIRG00374 family)